jgi:hypothetical protein
MKHEKERSEQKIHKHGASRELPDTWLALASMVVMHMSS